MYEINIGGQRTCRNCDPTCGECQGSGANACTECRPGQMLVSESLILAMYQGISLQYAYDHLGVKGNCRDFCPEGTGPYEPMTEVCVPCPDNCETCSGGSCIACDRGYKKTEDGKCEIDCYTALPGCLECEQDTNGDYRCLNCDADFDTDGNRGCVPKCTSTQWANTGADPFACVDCDPSCLTCDSTNGHCITCQPFDITSGEGRIPNYGTAVNERGVCESVPCADGCEACDWDGDVGAMVCAYCQEGLRLNETGHCVTTDPTCSDGYYYNNVTGACAGCLSTCGRCVNGQVCQSCPDTIYPYLTPGGNCRANCPVGTRLVADGKCLSCSEGCNNCITEIIDDVEEEICITCSAETFLSGVQGCVSECPAGYYEDTLFRWCVKCDCECATCSGSRSNCTSCNPGSTFNEEIGECVQNVPEFPYAVMGEDYSSFDFIYPYAKFYQGYTTESLADGTIQGCKDGLLDLNWNDASMDTIKSEFEAAIANYDDLNIFEIQVLEQFISAAGSFNRSNYHHELETSNEPLKVLYYLADSWFGKDRSSVSRLPHPDSQTSMPTEPIEGLCELIFDNTNDILDDVLGANRECEFVEDDADENTRIRVTPGSGASFHGGSVLTTTTNFVPDQQLIKYIPDRYKQIDFEIFPNTKPNLLHLDMKVNSFIDTEIAKANCNSQIHLEWAGSSGLCGNTGLEINLEGVYFPDGRPVPNMETKITEFNDAINASLSGFESALPEYIINGNLLFNFQGYLMDLSIILTNCYPDKEQVRVLVEIV